jgi:hypothetical protein
MTEDTTPAPTDQRSQQTTDWRTFGIMVVATVIGVAWAAYNYSTTGGERGEAQLQPLVWTMFATPLALFLGWVVARRAEVWLAAFASFCVYFFTWFVAARVESLLVTTEQAAISGHDLLFKSAMIIHVLSAVALAAWRARQPYQPPDDRSQQRLESSSDAA